MFYILALSQICITWALSIHIVEDLNLRLRLGWGILSKPISCENNSSGGHIKKRKHKISVMLIYLFSGCESFLHFSHILFKLACIFIYTTPSHGNLYRYNFRWLNQINVYTFLCINRFVEWYDRGIPLP